MQSCVSVPRFVVNRPYDIVLPLVPTRILIKGGSGSGKSTLAREISRICHLPYVELDALNHGPNWRAASAEELQQSVRASISGQDGWVVDGNYDSKLGNLLLDQADIVVWIDLPLATKLVRLARRSARRWILGEPLWNGNRETLRGMFWGRDALFAWAIRTHFSQRRQWPVLLNARKCLRLCSATEVAAWLQTLG
jgi:hypothetical protein